MATPCPACPLPPMERVRHTPQPVPTAEDRYNNWYALYSVFANVSIARPIIKGTLQ